MMLMDQLVGVGLLLQKMERSGEIDTGHIVLPFIFLVLLEVILADSECSWS